MWAVIGSLVAGFAVVGAVCFVSYLLPVWKRSVRFVCCSLPVWTKSVRVDEAGRNSRAEQAVRKRWGPRVGVVAVLATVLAVFFRAWLAAVR